MSEPVDTKVPQAVIDLFAAARLERDHIVTPQRDHFWLGLNAPAKGAHPGTPHTLAMHKGAPDRATHYAIGLDIFRALHEAATHRRDPKLGQLHLVLDEDGPVDAPAVRLYERLPGQPPPPWRSPPRDSVPPVTNDTGRAPEASAEG